MYTYVILNGPSNHLMRGFDFADSIVFGCNYSYRDWPLTHLVCADVRMAEAVDKETRHFFNRYTKLPKYKNRGWQVEAIPGNDSGSYAINLALDLFDDPVIVIGADGLLGGDHTTVYTYPWRPLGPRPKVYDSFRPSVFKAIANREDRIVFLTNEPTRIQLPTQSYEDFLNEYETKFL